MVVVDRTSVVVVGIVSVWVTTLVELITSVTQTTSVVVATSVEVVVCVTVVWSVSTVSAVVVVVSVSVVWETSVDVVKAVDVVLTVFVTTMVTGLVNSQEKTVARYSRVYEVLGTTLVYVTISVDVMQV